MATESISDRREHVRSIGVTSVAALLGVGAAIASMVITGDPTSQEAITAAATDVRPLALVLAAIAVQLVAINASGLYTEEELGVKHYLFITFMTFSLWFVTWGILLTSRFTS